MITQVGLGLRSQLDPVGILSGQMLWDLSNYEFKLDFIYLFYVSIL